MHKATYKGRYKGHKGRYWDYLSDKVRMRDFIKYRCCISCGKTIMTWQELQAGHYAPAGNCGFYLLFHEDNIHGECAYCNGFNEGHLINYGDNLLKRIGQERYQYIRNEYDASRFKGKTTKEWTKLEYLSKLEQLKKECTELAKQV